MILKKLKRVCKVALDTAAAKSSTFQAKKMEEEKSQSILLEALKAHPKVKIRDSDAVDKKVNWSMLVEHKVLALLE